MAQARRPALVLFSLIVAGEAVFVLPFVVARVFRPTLLDVFGVTPRGFDLMSKIKERMDPNKILSPGRFVGRL